MDTPFLARAKAGILLDMLRFKSLCLHWSDIYEYYGHVLPEKLMLAFAEDCMDHDAADVHAAMVVWRRSPPPQGHKPRPPLPVDILNQLDPAMQADAEANRIAGRILAGISQYGYTQAKKAQAYVGDLGWRVVNGCGGWSNICQSVMVDNRSTYHAQFRDMARGELHLSEQGQVADRREAALAAIDATRANVARLTDVQSIMVKLTAKGPI